MLGVALAAIALGAVVVAPASAASGNDVVEIKNVAYGECLQAAQEQHGSPLIVACDGGADQRWEVIPVAGGRQLLRNVTSKDCLSETYGSYYCDDEGVHSFAAILPQPSGAVRIKLSDGERYLSGFTWSSGARDAWYQPLRDYDEQLWQVRAVGTAAPLPDTKGEVVRISSVQFDYYGCVSLTNGTGLTNSPCADVPEQKFQRIELPDGRTALQSLANGKCVTVREGQSISLDVASNCSPEDVRQLWTIEPTRTGAARVRQSADGQLLTPGSNWVFLYAQQTGAWQLWNLLPA
ncbi:hypothetical protein GCM10017774_61970 [Lentzea cavernae]|uniref:Ricin B lectin domain-containing protein n=2 Tax=Lentzea cavernae TaxID=2020703 RepID=A0ABQ3MKW7_9PSEU|nr:hypothetical protein GCM10017774_61970 [Lentzea cavernae]